MFVKPTCHIDKGYFRASFGLLQFLLTLGLPPGQFLLVHICPLHRPLADACIKHPVMGSACLPLPGAGRAPRGTHLRLPAGGWRTRAACWAPRPATASGWPSPTRHGGRRSLVTRPLPPARSGGWGRAARRRPGLPPATGRPRLKETRGCHQA